MTTRADFAGLSREELIAAVAHLVERGAIKAADVRNAAGRAERIATLERELATLRGETPGKGGKPKRHITRTPELIRARKLQGRYLGRLKKLRGAERARVKTAAKKEGVAAAVKLADQILKR